jgi:hypothetical protein
MGKPGGEAGAAAQPGRHRFAGRMRGDATAGPPARPCAGEEGGLFLQHLEAGDVRAGDAALRHREGVGGESRGDPGGAEAGWHALRLDPGDQAGEVGGRQEARIGDDDQRRRADMGDVGEAAQRVIGHARIDRRRHHDRRGVGQHERIAIGRLRRDMRRPQRAAGPRPVVHHHPLRQALREGIRQHPRDDVGGTAGRKGDDDADRPGRPLRLLREGRRAERKGGECREKRQMAAAHAAGSWIPVAPRKPCAGGTATVNRRPSSADGTLHAARRWR